MRIWPSVRFWRMTGGVAILVALAAVSIALTPPYIENVKLQRYVSAAVRTSEPAGVVQARIVNRAAELGLPVLVGNVKVSGAGNGRKVEIVYIVRVDFPLYTVDLHFHPAAGG